MVQTETLYFKNTNNDNYHIQHQFYLKSLFNHILVAFTITYYLF